MKNVLIFAAIITLKLFAGGGALYAQIPISNLPNTTNTVGAYIPVARNGYNYKIITDSLTNKKVDSLKVSGDTLYYYKNNGTRYFVGVIVGGSGSDTTSLSNRINLKLSIADTAAMLAPYLREVDTASLSSRINLKLNISDTASKTWDWEDITGKPVLILGGDTASMLSGYTRVQRFTDSLAAHTTRFNSVTSSLATKLNISDTANMRPRLYAGSNVTITGTYPNLTIASSGGGGSSDTSTFIVDTTYNRLAYAISADSLWLKSIKIQLNGSDITPTTTDSTLKWDILAGSGGGADTIPYSHNPADWLVSLPHRSVPYFYTSGVAGDPSGSYFETSQYTPAPVKITAGVNKGALFVATKGDFSRAVFGWVSRDNGLTWDTVGQIIKKSATGWDKAGASMPHLLYDSATNIIHMWYMGFTDSIYPPKFGVGYATASGDSYATWTKHGEVLSGTSVQSQMGLPHYTGYVKVSSVVKGRETGKYYYHGCYWPGNETAWADTTMRLWQGVTTNLGDPIDSMQQILAPTGTNTLLENPTVYYGDDGNYWMIYTNGYMDNNPVGGIDSAQYLQTAKTTSLKTPNWIKQPGIVFYPSKDSTWMGKRVYNAQLLKNGSGYYDRPISIRYDSAGRDTDGYEETYWMLFYSASYPNSYHDQGSILRILPQKQSQNTYAIGFNGDMPNILQKNGSAMVNIPMVDSLRRNGWISWRDYRTFHNKVKLGTAGRLAFYDSSLARVRDVPFISVTTGSYPTMTLGASGYSSFTLNFRNTAGTTGSISEDGGMIYRGSSSYKKHVFYDNITSPVMLANLYSSGGIAYAYFPGLTNFGSSGTAVSNLETSGSFGATIPAAKTANYTATASDYTILTDATSGAITITLPQASICGKRIYVIKKIDSSGNAVTVDANGSETIDGATTYSLASQWKYVTIQCNGTAWFVIGNN